MPMPSILTDLAALFTAREFGEVDGTVLFRGVVVPNAIFDDEDVEVELGDGTTEIVHQCVLTGPSASFPNIREGDQMTIRTRHYRVKYWNDDGTGVIEIHMVRA
jgi:hypothetical protein